MSRKLLALIIVTAVAFGGLAGVTLAQDNTVLTFSITDARGYAAKVSVSKEVIEIDRANDPCAHRPEEADDPNTTYDDCDANQYTHEPSDCLEPKGRAWDVPIDVPPGEETTFDHNLRQSSEPPPQASPVLNNDIATIANLTDVFGVKGSGGLASRRYVDNSGRSFPEAHTESDGFSVNRSNFEERCWTPYEESDPRSQTSYTHLFSRSGTDPSTVHFAQCIEDCRFATDIHSSFQTTAREATTTIKLGVSEGKLVGELFAQVKGLNFGAELVTAEEVFSYATFETDGTKEGWKATVISAADGVTQCGSPTELQPGSGLNPSSCGDFQLGMTKPYVVGTEEGDQLTIVLPGMVIAWNSEVPLAGSGSPQDQLAGIETCPPAPEIYGSENQPEEGDELTPTCPQVRQQTVHFAGVELVAGMRRASPATLPTFDDSAPLDTFSSLGTATFSLPDPPSLPTAGPPADPNRIVAIEKFQASVASAASLLAMGGIILLITLIAWIRRFSWGQDVFRIQPFRFFLWFYRAFIRT